MVNPRELEVVNRGLSQGLALGQRKQELQADRQFRSDLQRKKFEHEDLAQNRREMYQQARDNFTQQMERDKFNLAKTRTDAEIGFRRKEVDTKAFTAVETALGQADARGIQREGLALEREKAGDLRTHRADTLKVQRSAAEEAMAHNVEIEQTNREQLAVQREQLAANIASDERNAKIAIRRLLEGRLADDRARELAMVQMHFNAAHSNAASRNQIMGQAMLKMLGNEWTYEASEGFDIMAGFMDVLHKDMPDAKEWVISDPEGYEAAAIAATDMIADIADAVGEGRTSVEDGIAQFEEAIGGGKGRKSLGQFTPPRQKTGGLEEARALMEKKIGTKGRIDYGDKRVNAISGQTRVVMDNSAEFISTKEWKEVLGRSGLLKVGMDPNTRVMSVNHRINDGDDNVKAIQKTVDDMEKPWVFDEVGERFMTIPKVDDPRFQESMNEAKNNPERMQELRDIAIRRGLIEPSDPLTPEAFIKAAELLWIEENPKSKFQDINYPRGFEPPYQKQLDAFIQKAGQ